MSGNPTSQDPQNTVGHSLCLLPWWSEHHRTTQVGQDFSRSCSEQGQLCDQTRLPRDLSSQVLKTSKDRGCTASPGLCSPAGLSLQGKRFLLLFSLNCFPQPVSMYAHYLSASCNPPLLTPWLCFLDNLLTVAGGLLLDPAPQKASLSLR